MLKRKPIIEKETISSISNIATIAISLFVGISVMNMLTNKKGMLSNLIGGFVAILVGVSLMGTIGQELNNAICGSNGSIGLGAYNASYDNNPNGATDSFGGAGASHFGGYDGTVKHSNWMAALAPVKSDKSLFFNNETCIEPGSVGETMLNLVPIFFVIAIVGIGLATAYMGLRNSGIM